MQLVIVESPAKAKTINKYLGDDYKVIASFGHIRDLPSKSGSVLPAQDFAMIYNVAEKSTKYVDEILRSAAKAQIIYLATDPDREGEAISWHIAEVIKEHSKPKSNQIFKRIAFNEITKTAVLQAIKNAREIDLNLVNAQQARRALDYLVGFTLSPLLWRKLPGCKSAGRVQSVALKLVCQREEEIEVFKTEEYWTIQLEMLNIAQQAFTARLTHVNQQKLEKFSITAKSPADDLVELLKSQHFSVTSLEKKQQKRSPPPPFITSSLQQEAARKLGFSAKKTMQIAQKLYEGINIEGDTTGLITYMRTDGVSMSAEAVISIRALILSNYGELYLPLEPKIYKSKVKNAQEAHEAIRPTQITLIPDYLKAQLDPDYYRLYQLIWQRTVACQMNQVIVDLVAARLDSANQQFSAKATGMSIAFDGFYKVYREGIDDEQVEENKILPELKERDQVTTKSILPLQHFTEPLPRYSEASLVKKLEELGIGRPSTYAPILSVLQERKYVSFIKKRFVPDPLGRLLTVFLTGFFKQYVEYDFTARLEDELDEVAGGRLEWKSLLRNFWQGFSSNVEIVSGQKITDIIHYVEQALELPLFGPPSPAAKACPLCASGGILSLKLSRFGAFLACSNYPACDFKKQIIASDNISSGPEELTDDHNKIIGQDPQGVTIYLKKGPYGWYLQLGEQLSKLEKPKRVPLPASIPHTSLTAESARQLIGLPAKLGQHPEDNGEITMGIGKYGPYLKHNNKFVSIPKTLDPFTVTTEQAVAMIAANKKKLQ